MVRWAFVAVLGIALALPGTAQATPSITKFTPSSGPAGTVLKISGSGFTGATAVTIGGAPASFNVLTDKSIRAVVPPTSPGGPVEVHTPGGTTEGSTPFTLTQGVVAFPRTAPPGGRFAITGSGLPPNATFDVEFDGRRIGSGVASSVGGFQLNGLRVPLDATLTLHDLLVLTATGAGIQFPYLVQGDWPMERESSNGTGDQPIEYGLNTSNVPGLKQKWSFVTSAPVGLSPPVVVGNVLTTGATDGRVYSIDTVTNKGWSVQPAGQIIGSPAVANGTIYIGDGFSLFALDAATGATKWHVDTYGTVACSPVVDGNTVYFSGWNGTAHAVWAVNAKTGAVKWSTPLQSDTTNSVGSPAVDANNVYVGDDDGHVYAIDRSSGTIVWHKAPGGYIEGTPAVSGGSVWFVTLGSGGEWVRSFDTTAGAKNWAVVADVYAAYSSPAYDSGKLFVVTGKGVVALNAASGASAWTYPVFESLDDTAPAVANGVVYAVVEGTPVAINEASGAGLWSASSSYPGPVSSPVVADGRVYFGTQDNMIHAFGL